MKPALVDTDILSLFFRAHPAVVNHFAEYLKEFDTINLSIITYYEIVSGLKHRDALKQMDYFLEFAKHNTILPVTESSANLSAALYARLRKSGRPLDDTDLLIAGIAIDNQLVLATRNQGHFERIEGLAVEDWSLTN